MATHEDIHLKEASNLLHHLLNQSLSGLDFCILWQRLCESGLPEELVAQVNHFLEEADLGSLDRALAMLPEPESEKLEPLSPERPIAQDGWKVSSTRIREVSRADFQCASCDFTITLAQEHAPNTEMRLPYDNFSCPFCDVQFADQGSARSRTNRNP